MGRIKLAVFDMAGTVVNENNLVYKTLQNAINTYGNYQVTLDVVLEHGAGKEKHQAIIDILTFLDKENVSQSEIIFTKFKPMLNEAYNNLEVSSFDGVEALISQLKKKDVKVVLNTGYNSIIANSLLEKMGWKKGIHYDGLVTADDVENGRPNPDMIHKAMNMFGIKNGAEVLKAGDSVIDIEEGKNAQCGITIGVTTGAQTRTQLELAKPTYILDSLVTLTELLF